MNGTTQFGSQVAGNYNPSVQGPKPIGLMQRADGVRQGLAELQDRLQALAARLNGEPTAVSETAPSSIGIPNILDASEAHLRECLRLVGGMNDAF